MTLFEAKLGEGNPMLSEILPHQTGVSSRHLIDRKKILALSGQR